MQEALGVQDAVPGFVGSLQTFGSYAVNWHPHVHGIVSEGIFERDGTFHTLWTLGVDDIEQRFREAVIAELCKAERLSEEFALTLLGWEHSGFSVFAGRHLSPVQPRLIEETGSYIARPPIAGDLPQPLPDGRWCVATPPDPITGATEEVLDPLELLHRIVCQIPEPGAHMVRYYGAYSSRGRRVATEDAEAQEEHAGTEAAQNAQSQAGEDSEHTRARRRSWARLMRKILEVDPLQCPGCGEEMRIIAFITEPETVDRILKHIAGKRDPPRDEDEL